ncbi:MAG: hypothetical protein Fur005_40540 [Roseiflexaceae bacterium]
MSVRLRPATLDDVAFLADVVIVCTLAQGRFPADLDLASYRVGYEDWTRETVLGAIPNSVLSVIEVDQQPIGRLRVVRDESGITLAGIQILPAYQNRGIGTLLITQLQREADQYQCPLWLSVEKDNPHARRLYQRLGFQLVQEQEQDYHLVYRT